MNPSDVNRLNYNCHYIGQNLDYLVREKMKSESFITPLKVTPKYYEDEVTKKMKLLGNRGHYFPEYYEQNRMQYTNDNLPPQYMDNRFPVPYSPPPQQRYIPTPQRTEEITYQPQPYNNSLNKYNEELELKLREQENEKRKYELNGWPNEDKLYKGNIYIPLSTNPIDAMNADENNIKASMSKTFEEAQ